MKTLLSILLGLMLLTSTLVGTAYATPTIQPLGSYSCWNAQTQTNNPNCAQNINHGGPGDPHGGCTGDKNSPDTCRGCTGITPNDLETSNIQPDLCE